MPNNWGTFRLGEICTKIGSGATPRGGKKVYLDQGIFAFIRSQNVLNGGFRREGLAYIGENLAEELDNVEVLDGDVLLNITGDSVARCCQVDNSVLPARVNQHVAIIRPNPSRLDQRFLRYLLVSPTWQRKLLQMASAGATRNALTKGMLESLEVRVPFQIEEQRAIAKILGTLDDKIELNRKMNDTLEAMARALFKSWFVDFHPVRAKMDGSWRKGQSLPGLPAHLYDLFPGRLVESELGEIPEGWGVVPLPKLVEVNPQRLLRKGDVAPYLDMANVPTRGHSPEEVVDRPFGSGMRFENGDTLVARITPCLENGKTAYVDFLEDGQVGWGSTEFIVLRPQSPLPEEFAYCLARSEEFREFAIQSMTGSSGRQRVPSESLSHLLLASPPDQLGERFGSIVRSLFTHASAGAREARTLAALRDTLLPKLISGDLWVKNPTNFVQEVAK